MPTSRLLSRSLLPSAPDLPGALVGWRVWRVDPDYRLRSALHDDVWASRRPFLSACALGHASPDERCGCGVYALRRPEQAQAYLVGRNSPEAVHRVLGRVALWGRVVECERGWRGERAYPTRLWVPNCRDAFEIAFALGRYGVPVEIVPSGRASDVVLAAAVG